MLECFVVIFEKSFLFEKGKNQWWVRWFAVFIFLFKILKIITQKLLWRIVYGPWETPYVFGCFRKLLRGCLVCDFKQSFSVFKQYFTHFNTLFHSHVFSQIFSNNNFQFLNTYTKRTLKHCGIFVIFETGL